MPLSLFVAVIRAGCARYPGAVAVGDEDGYVHFLSPRTGEEMARVRLSGPIVTQAQPFSAGAIFQTSKGEVAYLSNR